MNFLLYTTGSGKTGSIQLGHPSFWVPLLLLLAAVLSAVGGLGYYLGHRAMAVAASAPRAEEQPHWRAALEEQKHELTRAREQAQNQLNALAVRLGQMQAQVLRMEALGQRLSETARLDKFDFDFDQLPARGGPADPSIRQSLSSADFLKALDDLALQIDDRERQLEVMEQLVSNSSLKNDVSPTGRPIRQGWLSSYFGMRTDPFTGHRAMHKGIDFAGKLGSDIVATAAGVVTWAGKRYGYGNLVEINHGGGYATRYGHAQKILVKVGDEVEAGQTIALMGSSGRSTGPHVHYEVLKNGRQVNPMASVRLRRGSTVAAR
ncbi:MAG TPA: hypothetical protein ENK05_03615 [Gammaproteobacteria bacterium]|nr:hypothetical protein [Gammaproteobacteria bacterium]